MTTVLVQLLLGSYTAFGVLAALVFVSRKLAAVDPAVRGAPFGFKALIFPGLVALWPLFVLRWLRGSGHPPEEHTAHRERVGANQPQGRR